jgi:ATP-dependent helicase HrpA
VVVRYDWSLDEAEHHFTEGAVVLARYMLERQLRDLRRKITADSRLLLAASPFVGGDVLADLLLQLTVARACFDDALPPRERVAFDAAVERGRAELAAAFEATVATVGGWFTAGRAVRRLLEQPRARSHRAAVEATELHLRQLLQPTSFLVRAADWRRQLPRYIKAEERRWERLFARGGEPAEIGREIEEWTTRSLYLAQRVAAEKRWLKQVGELEVWFEEYRISLYAQDIRTLGPISAARLSLRAAEIEAWLTR